MVDLATLPSSSAARLLPPRPPTPILPCFRLSRIAPLGFRLAVKLPAQHVVDASLPRIGGEVALDGLSRWAGPRVFGGHAGTCLLREFLGLLRLRFRLLWLPGQAILIVGAFRAVACIPAHIAPRVRGATVPAMAA